MLQRRVAPTAVIARLRKVRWAEVCGSDGDGGTLSAPLSVRLVVADDPIALPAGCAVVE